MGAIGIFGNRIVFETSDRRILTFSNMTKKIKGNYTKHSIIGQKDYPEFKGPGNDTITFKIFLDASFGLKPSEVMDNIEEAVETAETNYLIIGGKMIGKNKFYISYVSEAMDVIMGNGAIARATLNISMEEYV